MIAECCRQYDTSDCQANLTVEFFYKEWGFAAYQQRGALPLLQTTTYEDPGGIALTWHCTCFK